MHSLSQEACTPDKPDESTPGHGDINPTVAVINLASEQVQAYPTLLKSAFTFGMPPHAL